LDGAYDQSCGDDESDPKAGAAQEFERIQPGEPIDDRDVRVLWKVHDNECLLPLARNALGHDMRDIPGAEDKLLDRTEREPW
jgi:hypothetical protein